jgi:hypothetical protein
MPGEIMVALLGAGGSLSLLKRQYDHSCDEVFDNPALWPQYKGCPGHGAESTCGRLQHAPSGHLYAGLETACKIAEWYQAIV